MEQDRAGTLNDEELKSWSATQNNMDKTSMSDGSDRFYDP